MHKEQIEILLMSFTDHDWVTVVKGDTFYFLGYLDKTEKGYRVEQNPMTGYLEFTLDHIEKVEITPDESDCTIYLKGI